MDIERVVVRMIADSSQYNRALGAMEGRLLAFAQRSVMLGNSLSVPFIVAAGAVTGVATAMIGASTVALKLAADYQSAAIAFEVMTGGANTAKDILRQINQLAIETPFRSGELQEGAKQLKAFGFATDQLLPTLRALGEVSSGTGTKMERIILAFGQVRVAGRLMGPEVRQMVDAGVPIFEYLAKVMQKPVTSIKGLVEEGKVGFPEVVRAFNMMTQEGGIFFNMMERQSQTAAGRWSAFVETLEIALRDIGLAFFEGFGVTDVLEDFRKATAQGFDRDRVIHFFEELRRGFDDFRAFLHMLGEWVIANQELLSLLGQIILGVVAFWAVLAGLRTVLSLVLIPVTLLVGQFSVLFRVVGVTGAAFLVFGDLPKHFMALYEWVTKTYNSVNDWNAVLRKVVGTVILAATVFYTWRAAVLAVTLVMTVLQGVVTAFVAIQTAITAALAVAPWLLLAGGIAAVVYQFDLLDKADISWLKDLLSIDLNGFFNRMDDFGGRILEVFQIIGPEIKRLFEEGDLKEAFEVALEGIRTAFKILLVQLKVEWNMFQRWLKDSVAISFVRDDVRRGVAGIEDLVVDHQAGGDWHDIDAKNRRTAVQQVDDSIKARKTAANKETEDMLEAARKAQDRLRTDLVDRVAVMGLRRGDYLKGNVPGTPDAAMDETRFDFWMPRLKALAQTGEVIARAFGPFGNLIRAGLVGPAEMTAFGNLPDVPGVAGRPGGGAGGGFWERLGRDVQSGMASGGIESMRVDHVSSTAVHELAKDLRREFEKEQTQGIGTMGGGRTDFFFKQMDVLKEGLVGPLGKASAAMSAITGVGMTSGMTARHGIMDEKLYEFGMVRNFGILRDWVKRREHEDITVKAYAKGTSEAMDVINKNLYKPQTAMEQVRDILMRAELYEKEDQKMYAEMVNALKQIATERGVSLKIGGFGPNDDHVAPMPRPSSRVKE